MKHATSGDATRKRMDAGAERRNPTETLVEARRQMGMCDDAVLRTRVLMDIAASGGDSVVCHREARLRAELLEARAGELARALKALERAAEERDERWLSKTVIRLKRWPVRR